MPKSNCAGHNRSDMDAGARRSFAGSSEAQNVALAAGSQLE